MKIRTNIRPLRQLTILLAILALVQISGKAPGEGGNTVAENNKALIYSFSIDEEIGPAMWRRTQQCLEQARDMGARAVIIHMNTYGGLVDAADSIRSLIMRMPMPVYILIENNAASAGALIAIACDSIYMRTGATIGAASVVNQKGELAPEKYQSYLRSKMRATAESHGADTIISDGDTTYKWFRDPLIAEGMVDPRVYIAGVTDTGKVITFTTDEAIKHGYCEAKAENIGEVVSLLGYTEGDYKLYTYQPSTLEQIIGFLINPMLQGLLLMIILGGIYFELQSPGIGFPLAASAIAALLYFAPLYLEGLAENWEILLFLVGLVLIGLEIFVVPGTGITGISGAILVITGLTLSMVDNLLFTFEGDYMTPVLRAFFTVVVSLFLSLVLSLWMGRKMLGTGRFSKLVLNATQQSSEGYISVSTEQRSLIGRTGVAASTLRPNGRVIIDGEHYDANAASGYIEKGEEVKVVRYETSQLYVRKIKKEQS